MDIARERDIEQLRRLALLQKTQIELLLSELQKKSTLIDTFRKSSGDFQASLEGIQAQLQRSEVGQHSHDSDGPSDKSEDSENATASSGETESKQDPSDPKPARGHGPTPQPDLERQPLLCELDEPDCICPVCGLHLKPFEGQGEMSEMITVIDVQYVVQDVCRLKYICDNGCCIETAPGPERAVKGGRYSLEFGVQVAVDKYDLHMPLERQAYAMKRRGLQVTASTLWDQIDAIAQDLKPTFEALKDFVLSQTVVGLDQTCWPRLDSARQRAWQMWAFTTPLAVFFVICGNKSAEMMLRLLGDAPRTVVCDMLSSHLKAARDCPQITLAGCWAHVFRRFREALPNFPHAQVVMRLIKELYEIDAVASSLEEKAELRQTQSKHVLDELKAFLESEPVLGKTSYGAAVKYLLAHWDYFVRFIEDPTIPLDNNRTELALRTPVVGRKNHYGSKSTSGIEVASLFYSLIQTAKRSGVDVTTYLVEATKAGRRGEALLPWDMDA